MRGVRRLPFVLPPLPDEPFDSWFQVMGDRLDATAGELEAALGLRADVQAPLPIRMWATALTEKQLDSLEHATGIARDVLRATTRTVFAGSVVQRTDHGTLAPASLSNVASARYCPDCLADSGGRWRLSWEFPFGFACLRHRRLLADTCPACGQPPNRRLLRKHVPHPGRCANPRVPSSVDPAGESPQHCEHVLGAGGVAAVVAHPDVLAAQRLILRIVSQGEGRGGIWASGPQPAHRALTDWRTLARFVLEARARPHGIFDERFTRLGFPPRTTATGRRFTWKACRAADVAAGYTIAGHALHDPDLLTRILQRHVKQATPYAGMSPQLQARIAETRGSRRRITFALRTSSTSGDPVRRAGRMPAMMWPEWTDLLSPHRLDRGNASSALAAAVIVVGSQLTHTEAVALLDPTAPARQVTLVMRELGRHPTEFDSVAAIVRLAEHLDATPTTIDYARRRALDYTHLLPAEHWESLAIAANVHTGHPRRGILARAHLHRLLSGNSTRRLPTADRLTPDSPPPTDAEITSFTRNAPPRVLDALEQVAADFLTVHGIHEPVTWQPDPQAVGMPDFPRPPLPDPGETWSPRRPVRGAPKGDEHDRILALHRDGASIRTLAHTLGQSRQTITRILTDHGIPLTPGCPRQHTIDPAWVREQHTHHGRTVADIAVEIGCSTSTIRRVLASCVST